MDDNEFQKLLKAACNIAAQQTRSGRGDHIICHPDVANGIQDAFIMRDRAIKINKLLKRIQT